MNPIALGLVIGASLAGGVWLVIVAVLNKPKVMDRVLPLVRATGGDTGRLEAMEVTGVLSDLRAPLRRRGVRLLDQIWGEESTRIRLQQAGLHPDVERYRLEQLRWATFGALAAVGLGLARLAAGRPVPAVVWLVACGFGALLGAAARDQTLSRAAAARRDRIAGQLPAIAELLAFTVASGLAPVSAMHRVAIRSKGELAAELRRCTDEIAAGANLADSLEAVATRTGAPSVRRFVDGIVVAMERGTPIADVLRAQAMDARDAGHRALMESVGRREIYALVPVVFLILPVVVVVAVYPGFAGLVVESG